MKTGGKFRPFFVKMKISAELYIITRNCSGGVFGMKSKATDFSRPRLFYIFFKAGL